MSHLSYLAWFTCYITEGKIRRSLCSPFIHLLSKATCVNHQLRTMLVPSCGESQFYGMCLIPGSQPLILWYPSDICDMDMIPHLRFVWSFHLCCQPLPLCNSTTVYIIDKWGDQETSRHCCNDCPIAACSCFSKDILHILVCVQCRSTFKVTHSSFITQYWRSSININVLNYCIYSICQIRSVTYRRIFFLKKMD